MNMKDHLLAALREQMDAFARQIASMSNEQRLTPLSPSEWTVKDILAHLTVWQRRSSARIEATRFNRKPEYPSWLPGIEPEMEDSLEQINAWIYAQNKDLPWETVYQGWQDGYKHFIELSERLSERELLDSDLYVWLKGYSLADVLLGSYGHHQEHLEKLKIWLMEHSSSK